MLGGTYDEAGTDTGPRGRILVWRADDGARAAAAAAGTCSGEDIHRRIRHLRAALRRERMRGRAGHWTYDLTRHLSLARQLRTAEEAGRQNRA